MGSDHQSRKPRFGPRRHRRYVRQQHGLSHVVGFLEERHPVRILHRRREHVESRPSRERSGGIGVGRLPAIPAARDECRQADRGDLRLVGGQPKRQSRHLLRELHGRRQDMGDEPPDQRQYGQLPAVHGRSRSRRHRQGARRLGGSPQRQLEHLLLQLDGRRTDLEHQRPRVLGRHARDPGPTRRLFCPRSGPE